MQELLKNPLEFVRLVQTPGDGDYEHFSIWHVQSIAY